MNNLSLINENNLFSDSIRELKFWKGRDKKIHGHNTLPCTRDDFFKDKDIVEFGCGFGCNLISVEHVAKSITGIELEPTYIEASKVFSNVENFNVPNIINKSADNTGLPSNSADIVMLMGSIQYMPIENVIKEAHRILRPNGTLLIVCSDLKDFMKSPFVTDNKLRVFFKTILYPIFGKIGNKSSAIHLPKFLMKRIIKNNKFKIENIFHQAYENWFVCRK